MRKGIALSVQHKLERPIEESDLYFIVKCKFKIPGFVEQEAEIGFIDKCFDKKKFESKSKAKYISHKELSKSDYLIWKTT